MKYFEIADTFILLILVDNSPNSELYKTQFTITPKPVYTQKSKTITKVYWH